MESMLKRENQKAMQFWKSSKATNQKPFFPQKSNWDILRLSTQQEPVHLPIPVLPNIRKGTQP